MRTICILGAGQFGRSATILLNTNNLRLLAYGDNNQSLNGKYINSIPVLSVSDAVNLAPDCLLIGIIDMERTNQLKEQALLCGFHGEFLTLRQLYQNLDIRSATLYRLADRLKEQKVSGSVAELGVYKGDTAWQLNALFPERILYLFDTFEGFDLRDTTQEQTLDFSRAQKGNFSDTSEATVLNRLPYPHQAIIRKGYFPQTARGLEDVIYAFVSLDADLYAPTLAGLNYFYPRLSHGGMIILHDYNNERFRGVKQAVDDYEKNHGALPLVTLCDLHGSAVIVRA